MVSCGSAGARNRNRCICNGRSNIFQNEFTESLKSSDKVILAANSLQTTVEDSSNLDCQKIVEELIKSNIESVVVTDLEKLQTNIDAWANEESILLILSNRTCLGLWESNFVENLS